MIIQKWVDLPRVGSWNDGLSTFWVGQKGFIRWCNCSFVVGVLVGAIGDVADVGGLAIVIGVEDIASYIVGMGAAVVVVAVVFGIVCVVVIIVD